MDPAKREVWDTVTRAKSTLDNPTESQHVMEQLDNLKALLINTSTPAQQNTTQHQHEFMSSQYVPLLEFLIEHITVDWIKHIPQRQIPNLFDAFFLQGCAVDSLLVLTTSIAKTRYLYLLLFMNLFVIPKAQNDIH